MAMADESPPASPLSILSSDEFEADDNELEDGPHSTRDAAEPPAKRQKFGSLSAPDASEIDFDNISISTDSSGDVPNSPSSQRPEDEETIQEQVTNCAWEGCYEELGNMDQLVDHIHNAHIEGKQKKFTCEWEDCSRKSLPHASGYALKAHMRSHTREKPFYCALPECDRSFTRSDALAKHMRTVHETEALRPSDPIPKSMQPSSRISRLKLILKNSQNSSPDRPGSGLNQKTPGSAADGKQRLTPFPVDLNLGEEEADMPPRELYRLLRRQVHWAEQESEALHREIGAADARRRCAWDDKEALMAQVVENEVGWHGRRQVVLAAERTRLAAAAPAAIATTATFTASAAPAADEEAKPTIGKEEGARLEETGKVDPGEQPQSKEVEMTDPPPSEEQLANGAEIGTDQEAAAVLAAMHQG